MHIIVVKKWKEEEGNRNDEEKEEEENGGKTRTKPVETKINDFDEIRNKEKNKCCKNILHFVTFISNPEFSAH